MNERWLSVEEIANHLGVSKDTIYAWRDKKGLPAHRIGRFWKFKAVEVDTCNKRGQSHFK
jgi:excisionase family DNA binding protein